MQFEDNIRSKFTIYDIIILPSPKGQYAYIVYCNEYNARSEYGISVYCIVGL